MSVIFMDGFDTYGTSTDLAKRGWAVLFPFDVVYLPTGGRFGGGAVQQENDTEGRLIASPAGLSGNTTVVIGLARFWKSTRLGGSDMFLNIQDENGVSIINLLQISGTGQLQVRRNTTVLGTAPAPPMDQWVWVEMKVVFNATTGSVEVRYNEGTAINLTNQNTIAGTGDPHSVVVGPSSNSTADGPLLDDFMLIVDDATGLVDFPGDTRISTLRPDGAGSQSAWAVTGAATNREAVDEGGASDEDTSYVESDVNGNQDLYTFGNLPIIPTAIHLVQVGAWCKKENAGSRTLNMLARSGTTTGQQATDLNLGTDYTIRTAQFLTNPDTLAAWSGAEVDGAEFGYEPAA